MVENVKAILKYIRISPQKLRLVVNEIRGVSAEKAMNILLFNKRKAATFVKSVLFSAISNAEHNNGMDIDNLYISSVYVNHGPIIKRFRIRAKGRSNRILKRTAHIVLMVSEKKIGREN